MIDRFKKEGAKNVSIYILKQKQDNSLSNVRLSDLLGVNASSITKILQGKKQGVKASFFYNLYKSFNVNFVSLAEVIYPGILSDDYPGKIPVMVERKRNDFGKFMMKFESTKTKTRNLSELTGIDVIRLDNLYYSDASLQAYELILIEKAIGKKPGELFELYFGNNEQLK
ncbi:hypothetical protein [Myroides sp. LJL119]